MGLTLQDLFNEGNEKLSGFKQTKGQLSGFQEKKGFSNLPEDRSPRQIMRDDYGWKMNDQQYEHMEGQKGEFNRQLGEYRSSSDAEIAKARGSYDEQRGAFESSIASGQQQLDAARAELGKAPSIDEVFNKWYGSDNANISIINGGQVVGTWKAPKSIVQGYSENMQGSYSNWISGNHFVIEQRQPKGYGGAQYAWDAVKAMTDRDKTYEAFVSSPEVQGSYAGAVGQWSAANSKLQEAQGTFNQSVAANQQALGTMNNQINSAVSTRDTNISKAEAARKGELDAMRNTYLEGLAAKKKAYGNLKNMKVQKGVL